MPINTRELQTWLALRNVPGIGSRLFSRLIDRFGSPEAVFSAPRPWLLAIEGMSGKIADAVAAAVRNSESIEKEIECIKDQGYRFITRNCAEYPSLLSEIHDPPPFIYAYGKMLDQQPAVAIVGSRHPTRYGISMAQRLSSDLAALGITIVSGMARGIDTAAHLGALAAGGKTTAVLGSGLCVVYPPENKRLYNEIARSGTVVSEQPVFEPPNAYNFPARNRIISGMTLGTVVVEAARKSGSLITAKFAVEQGREVFAVPGNINSFKSAGAHNLLKQGAKLVETVEDILEELSLRILSEQSSPKCEQEPADPETRRPGLTPEESDVYYSLDPYPVHIDELARRISFDTASLSAILLNLELKGLVIQMPGKFFCTSGD